MQTTCLSSLRSLFPSFLQSQAWYILPCVRSPTLAPGYPADVCSRGLASTIPCTSPERVTLDISAVQRLQELIKDSPGQFLRVSVDPGGCSGFQYVFVLDDNIQDDDMKFSRDGVSLAVDKVSMEFLKGSTIEFAEDLIASSFRVKDNPNSEQSCGCGSSFAAKLD